MEVISKIQNLLKNSGKSQKELCDYLGLHRNVFSEWKAGRNNSYMKYIDKIATYFEVSTDYLLGSENIKVYDEDDNIVVIDDETREIIDSLRTSPEMKILFSVSQKATKEDIMTAVKILKGLRGSDD